MIDVVFKFSNQTAFFNRLVSLGLSLRRGTNEETGAEYRDEELLGYCSTPMLEDVNGDKYFTARLTPESANKFPPDNNPAFAIIWRSDELDETDPEAPVPYPWPKVEVQAYDIDGNPAGTRMQGVGRII